MYAGNKNLYVKSEYNNEKYEVSKFPNPTNNNFNLIIKLNQNHKVSLANKKAVIKLTDAKDSFIYI